MIIFLFFSIPISTSHTLSFFFYIPHISIPSPQNFDLFLPAVLQRLAAAGPRHAVLRLAGGQHSHGGVSGWRTPPGDHATGRIDSCSMPSLRLLTAGKSNNVLSSWEGPTLAIPINSFASWCLSSSHHWKSVKRYNTTIQRRVGGVMGASAGPWQEVGPPGRRHQTQLGPIDPMRREVTQRGSRVSNVRWRDVNSSIRRERRGDRCSVYLKMSPSSRYAYSSKSRGWTRANLIQPQL